MYVRRISALYALDNLPYSLMDSMEPLSHNHAGLCCANSGKYSRLSKDDINILPLFHYTGKVTLIRTPQDMDNVTERLDAESLFGFDTETRPSFCKGKSHSPSLIQLAGQDEVFLFHLKWLPLNPTLIQLFENPSITKAGVAVHDDMRFLAKLAPFTPRAVIDLSEVARKNGIANHGLRGLAAAFLGIRISKSEQCSNWGSKELSPRQIRYAATDAWASRAVYLRMRESGLRMS